MNTPSMTPVQLIRGRWIFTGDETLTDGAIALQGDTILTVGNWHQLRAQYPDAMVHGSEQFAILPGLINAHHHSNGVPHSLQGIDDDFLELWLLANLGLRSQDPTLKTLLSIAALLKGGVTTVLDVVSIGGSVEDSVANLQGRLNAYDQSGMRVAMAPGASYSSFLVHGDGEDHAFVASLPDALRQRVEALIPLEQSLSAADYLDTISEFVKTYQSHPHIDVWFGPPGPQWVSDELMVQIADRAARLNTGVQTHALESFYEKLIGPRYYGQSVIAHLHQLGVLSPRFSIAHGVWLSDEDMALMAETGASVSHNPSSNLRLRAGMAPLSRLLETGVTVGLGMDGTTLNDDEDMFTEIRLAARLQRTPQLNHPAPSLTDVFRVATQGSAALLMQGQALGKIAPGYKADLVLVRSDRLTFPWVAPEADPLQVVLMRARSGDVDTVFVNGKIVLKEGQPTGFDLKAVGEAIANQLTVAPDRQEYRALVTDLLPHMNHWYAAWDVPPLAPYAAFNSSR